MDNRRRRFVHKFARGMRSRKAKERYETTFSVKDEREYSRFPLGKQNCRCIDNNCRISLYTSRKKNKISR